MHNMVIDKRLLHIHSIKSEKDVFEVLQPKNDANEKLYTFTSPIDQVTGGMFEHKLRNAEEEKMVISDLEENLNPYKDSPWEYAEQIMRFYDTCNLSMEVFTQCLRVLRTNQITWFEWVTSIKYAGIQSIFLQYTPSIQSLLSYLQYLQQHPEKSKEREYLVSLIILTFIHKLAQIDSNIEIENRSWDKKFDWNISKWEVEANSHIAEFSDILFHLPAKQIHNIYISMLSNLWIYNARRNKYDNKFKNKILELLVAQLNTEDDVRCFLYDSRWSRNKCALLHKLLIYVQWRLKENKKSNDCVHLLWQQVIACLETKGTYLYYEQPDEQTFSWVFAKLLSDEPEPLTKIKTILERYHQRFGVWNRDYDQVFQMQRARFFFLSVGAMATEWLLRENNNGATADETTKTDTANALIQFIFHESQIAIDGFPDHTSDEINFLQQFWARFALFQAKDTTIEEAKHMIAAIDSITTIEYRFITITVFLKNLTQDKKGKWFKDIFVHNIQNIINRDNKMLDYWPEPLARDVKRIKERETAIRQMLRC